MNVIQFTKKGKIMNSVNKTLYIPLYGKSFVSKKGIILKDEKLSAELDGKQIKKLIIVPNRLINIIA